jgi:hypothetical protein
MATLSEARLSVLFKLCKAGTHLAQICAILREDSDTVVAALASKIDIPGETMNSVFALRERGSDLEDISETCSVPLWRSSL